MGIKLDLTINDTNAILQALGDQPFKTVAQIISKIQQQGAPQAEAVAAEEKAAAEAEAKAAASAETK